MEREIVILVTVGVLAALAFWSLWMAWRSECEATRLRAMLELRDKELASFRAWARSEGWGQTSVLPR